MMKKTLICILLLAGLCRKGQAQPICVSQQASVSFFSSTPLENVEGISKTASSAINLANGEMIFKAKNTSFEFKKKLMQEHFNENYMESDKYPESVFKGKIGNVAQLQKDGEYTLPVDGTLNVHGVSKNYHVLAKFTVKEGLIKANAKFKAKTADHGIQIPSIVITSIAEELDVTVSASYQVKQH